MPEVKLRGTVKQNKVESMVVSVGVRFFQLCVVIGATSASCYGVMYVHSVVLPKVAWRGLPLVNLDLGERLRANGEGCCPLGVGGCLTDRDRSSARREKVEW